MRTKILVVALAVALAIVASVVLAQGGKRAAPPGMAGSRMGMGMGMGPKLMQELNLTPDQIKQMHKLHADFMASTQGTRDQLKTKMQELAQLWAQDADANQLKAKLAEIDPLKAELHNAGVDFALQARSLLTDEQKAKVRQMIKDMPGCGMGMCCGLGMGCMCGQGMDCPMGAPGISGRGPTGTPGACPLGDKASCCPN
jgi:Spy/CpxP family protein refolding chaperone